MWKKVNISLQVGSATALIWALFGLPYSLSQIDQHKSAWAEVFSVIREQFDLISGPTIVAVICTVVFLAAHFGPHILRPRLNSNRRKPGLTLDQLEQYGNSLTISISVIAGMIDDLSEQIEHTARDSWAMRESVDSAEITANTSRWVTQLRGHRGRLRDANNEYDAKVKA